MKYFCHVKEPLMGIFPLERNTSTNYSFDELEPIHIAALSDHCSKAGSSRPGLHLGPAARQSQTSQRLGEPADAIIRIAAACVCGSDLWPYRAMDERRAIKTLLWP